MKRMSIIALALLFPSTAGATPAIDHALQVEVHRKGDIYTLSARFDSSLSQCAAYRYLTDYESATKVSGILESKASREADNKVRVERTAEERILFMHIHLHSVLEFTEYPNEKLTFTQLSGDSKAFSGFWSIEPSASGSSLRFESEWEPDTLLPLFIIDYFAEHDLERRFGEIARLAEERDDLRLTPCTATRLVSQ